MKKIALIASFVFACAALCPADINFPGWAKAWSDSDGQTYIYENNVGNADTMTVTFEVGNTSNFILYTSLDGVIHDDVGDVLDTAILGLCFFGNDTIQFGGSSKGDIKYINDNIPLQGSSQILQLEVSWDDDYYYYSLYNEDRSALLDSFDMVRESSGAFLSSITFFGNGDDIINIAFSPVPEPAAFAVLPGVLALSLIMYRKRAGAAGRK